jgi:hypothetical protein
MLCLTPVFAHSSVFHCGKFYCRRKPKYARKPHFRSQLTDTFIPCSSIPDQINKWMIIPSTCDISNSRPLKISNKCKSTTPLLPVFHKTIYVCIILVYSSVFHCGKFYCRRKPKYARKPHFRSQLTDTFIPYGCIEYT